MKNPILKALHYDSSRLLRSGEWKGYARYVRVEDRYTRLPMMAITRDGFRIFRSLK